MNLSKRFGLSFQRLDLQADGRLAEEEFVRRIAHLAGARSRAKRPQLLECVALVIEERGNFSQNSQLYL